MPDALSSYDPSDSTPSTPPSSTPYPTPSQIPPHIPREGAACEARLVKGDSSEPVKRARHASLSRKPVKWTRGADRRAPRCLGAAARDAPAGDGGVVPRHQTTVS
ncbi:hypothetical protein JHW43_005913 [Diplocarpon mali]|nr:hypothetical protein JHW43_005913 [Diplocarpon mali]